MNIRLEELQTHIQHLEEEIEAELRRRRTELHADFEDRKIRFEREIAAAQRRLKTGLLGYFWDSSLFNVLSAPVIFSGIVPLVILDLFLTVYQAICFPLNGIPRVQRGKYFVFDHHHLGYLNVIEKLNCAYCSYANGLVAYFREIGGRTEQYWCPIKHARRVLQAHPYYHNFADFGDAHAYFEELENLRQQLAELAKPH